MPLFGSVSLRERRGIVEFTRVSGATLALLIGVRGAIAVNSRWTEPYPSYLENLLSMLVGFFVFSVLAARSRSQLAGLLLLSVALYFVGAYEIGGPSKAYLTPFDPLLGIEPVFARGRWLGLLSGEYRRWMMIATSALAAFALGWAATRRTTTPRHT